jgi:hypothetical protein
VLIKQGKEERTETDGNFANKISYSSCNLSADVHVSALSKVSKVCNLDAFVPSGLHICINLLF